MNCLLILFYEHGDEAASLNLKIEWDDLRNEDRPLFTLDMSLFRHDISEFLIRYHSSVFIFNLSKSIPTALN